MELIQTILSKLHYKELHMHLVNYCFLYIKPRKVWKNVVINRRSAGEIVVLHIMYYFFLILILVGAGLIKTAPSSTLFLVLADVALTLIPLIGYVIPFSVFVTLFKKRITWYGLFRVLLILKLQFLPVIYILIIIAELTGTEVLYLIIQNLFYLLFIAYIVIVPLILTLRWWQRLVWILANYTSMLFFIVFSIFLGSRSKEILKIEQSASISTPVHEYIILSWDYNYSHLSVQDKYLMLIVYRDLNGSIHWRNTQYVTTELLFYFKNNIKNDSLYKVWDVQKKLKDPERSAAKAKILENLIRREYLITLEKADSIDMNFKKELHEDIERIGIAKDSAKYKSNKRYFSSLYNYLVEYKEPFENLDSLKILNSTSEFVSLGQNSYAFLYQLDTARLHHVKRSFLKSEDEIEKREFYSTLVLEIISFPIEGLVNKIVQ